MVQLCFQLLIACWNKFARESFSWCFKHISTYLLLIHFLALSFCFSAPSLELSHLFHQLLFLLCATVTGFVLFACCLGRRSTVSFFSSGSYPQEVFQIETFLFRAYMTWEKPAPFAHSTYAVCMRWGFEFASQLEVARKKKQARQTSNSVLSGRREKVRKGSRRLLVNWIWGDRKRRTHRSTEYQI